MANRRLLLALEDFEKALFRQPICWHLAWQEVKQRYRRSVIGPFWITISTAVMIAAMGPLYGRLFDQPLGPYFQHLSIGLVVWVFISGFLNEACFAFIAAEAFIKEIKMPYSTYVLKMLVKHLIIFFHNSVIVLAILIFFPPKILIVVPLAMLGLIVLLSNLFWMGIVLAILCVRFRDISQIVASLVQIMFFLTPIIWQVDMLGDRRDLAAWNPVYHLVQIVRSPLLGEPQAILSWLVACGLTVVGSLLALGLFARFRNRISYWV